jgi:hypothetical protein
MLLRGDPNKLTPTTSCDFSGLVTDITVICEGVYDAGQRGRTRAPLHTTHYTLAETRNIRTNAVRRRTVFGFSCYGGPQHRGPYYACRRNSMRRTLDFRNRAVVGSEGSRHRLFLCPCSAGDARRCPDVHWADQLTQQQHLVCRPQWHDLQFHYVQMWNLPLWSTGLWRGTTGSLGECRDTVL